MSRLVVGLIWLLHWLPLGALARVGSGFGWLLYWVVLPRRATTRRSRPKRAASCSMACICRSPPAIHWLWLVNPVPGNQ